LFIGQAVKKPRPEILRDLCSTLEKSAEVVVSPATFLASRSRGGTKEGFAPDPMESFHRVWIAIRLNLILHFLFQLVTSEPDVGADNLLGLPIFAFSD
jgi:hypothetical protein